MKAIILSLLLPILFTACTGAIEDVPAKKGAEQKSPKDTEQKRPKDNNEEQETSLKDYLFSCDKTDSTDPSKSNSTQPLSPSVLHRVISHQGDTIDLNTKELKILVTELSSFKGWDHFREVDDIANKITVSNYQAGPINTEKIKKAVQNLAQSKSDFRHSSFLLKPVLGEDLLAELSRDTRFYSAWLHKYGDEFTRFFFQTEILNNIHAGAFADRKLAWLKVADYSPVFRKLLQRTTSILAEDTAEKKEQKRFLTSLFLSQTFTPDANDKHVFRLKSEFGQGISISGLARASVGATYLVTCRKNGKVHQFVAKASSYQKTDLKKKLDQELEAFEAYALEMLYPETKPEISRPKFSAPQSEHQEYERKTREAITTEILKEIDFDAEARNLHILEKSYAGVPDVRLVKGISWPIDKESYLLMEYAKGMVLSDVKALSKEQAVSLNKTLKSLHDHVIHRKGPYHADTHEGNIIIDNDGAVTLIDAGRINDALDEELMPYLIASEMAFAKMKKMTFDRSGDGNDELFSQAQRKTINDILSKKVELGKSEGIKRRFDESWNQIFFSDYKKNTTMSFRQFYIYKISFISQELKPLTKALRAIQLLDDAHQKYISPHGIASFIGEGLI